MISQALRAGIVAAETPLRGMLRAEATTFFIDQRILEVIYQRLQTLFVQVQGLISSGTKQSGIPHVIWEETHPMKRALG